jgi:hypothetical protein
MREPRWRIGWGRPSFKLASQFLGGGKVSRRISKRWISPLAAAITLWGAIGNMPWRIETQSFESSPSEVLSIAPTEFEWPPSSANSASLTSVRQAAAEDLNIPITGDQTSCLAQVLIQAATVEQALAASVERFAKEASQ